MGKDTVKLFVEKEPIENLNALRPKYESLGFNRTKNDEKCEDIMVKKNNKTTQQKTKRFQKNKKGEFISN